MFYNRKPNLYKQFFAYSHIPKETKNKFHPKREINIMVGYTNRCYRLWDTRKEKVGVARNVIFDEAKNISNGEMNICKQK